jgi:uncharacterized membrane protein
MKKFFKHARNRIITGFIFLIPLFGIVLLLQKLWSALTDAGNYLVQLVGLNSVLGSNSLPVAIVFILLILFYFFGWLVRFSSLKRLRNSMEAMLLKYIPAYSNYKAQLQEKINPPEDKRTPVWVATISGKRPGLLIDERSGESVVFFPYTTDAKNGEVVVVETFRVSKLGMTASSFLKCMQQFGKDLMGQQEDGNAMMA